MTVRCKELAARLKLTREALGWSQVDLCAHIGISPQVWNNVETGDNNLSLTNAVRLSQKTGLPLDWIYFGRLDTSAPTEFRKALLERQRVKRTLSK
jgi:transcriptional regulator with XRE-family HTH domain